MGKVLVPVLAAIAVVVSGIGLSHLLKEKPVPPSQGIKQVEADTPSLSPTPQIYTYAVSIFYIALSNNSKTKIGCGDSVVGIEKQVPPTKAPLTAAIEQLVSNHDRTIGESGLYNALYQSNLQLQNANLVNGIATINLTGTLKSGGVCDDPRIIAQFQKTAMQFPDVKQTQVFVNGKNLLDILSEK